MADSRLHRKKIGNCLVGCVLVRVDGCRLAGIGQGRRIVATAAVLLAALGAAAPAAHAFCGFYVNGAGGEMFNDATQVVLMRSGTRTVLAMQNNYKGPPGEFAMVIPVPTVLQKEDVKTLPKAVFEHVDQMGAPRLVEYWEEDPCRPEYDEEESGGVGTAMALDEGKMGKKDADGLGVTIEAKFEVGEYQVVVLSAKDSTGLDTWLRQERYQIPPGAEPFLRPYVESGMKFFVAKVDPAKVTFKDGRAALSPLRFHYDSDEFNLPIRLGLANSSGTQDLIVSILAPGQRYEVANYGNVTIPTNLDVKDAVRDKFGEFYAALFDRTVEKNPGAVVTEYAWQATNCDPCPGPTLTPGEINELGASVLPPDREGGRGEWVVTRLHARYDRSMPSSDLVFRQAPPIVGGNGAPGPGGALERAVLVGDGSSEQAQVMGGGINMFQARYADVYKGDKHWQAIDVTGSETYSWRAGSTYIANPPYFEGMTMTPAPVSDIVNAKPLAILGDSITTDHISPAGSFISTGVVIASTPSTFTSLSCSIHARMPFSSLAIGSSRSSGTAIRASRATLRTVFLSTLTFRPSIGEKSRSRLP